MSRYSQLIESESGLLAYLPLDSEYLLADRSGNNYGGTAQGGVTPGTRNGPFELSSTDFDGVDDHISTPLANRYNLATNPRAGAGATTGWANGGLVTFDTFSGGGAGLPAGITTGFRCIGNTGGDMATQSGIAAVSGATYTFSVYVKIISSDGPGVALRVRDDAGAVLGTSATYSTVGANFAQISITVTAAAAGTNWRLDVRQVGATNIEWRYSAVLIEEAASAGDYFDGDTSTDAGWFAAAHASISGKGAFVAGTTTRTFEILGVHDTAGLTQTAISADGASGNPFIRTNTSLDVTFSADGTTSVSWAAASPAIGAPFHFVVVYDGANATLYVNGALVSTQAYSTTYDTRPKNVQIGLRAAAANPWDGALAHFVVYIGDKGAAAAAHYGNLVAPPARSRRLPRPQRSFGNGTFTVMTIDPQTGVGYDLSELAQGLQWSNVNPGGDEICRFQLDVPWLTLLPGAAKGNLCRVLSGPDVLWDGRIGELDPGGDDSEYTQITAYGKGARLKDTTFQEIFVDSDFSSWQGMSVQRKINVLLAGTFTGLHDTDLGADVTTGAPSLETEFDGAWVAGALPFSEGWYDGLGVLIDSIYYAWKKGGTVDNTDTNFFWGVFASTDDVNSSSDSSGTLRAAGPGSGTLTTTGGNKTWAFVEFFYNAAGGTQGKRYSIFWTALAVYGTHGLTKGAGTPPGFTADQMIGNIVGRVSGVVARRIDVQTFEIQQMEFRVPTFHEDAIVELNKYEGCDWGTWGPGSILDFSSDGYFDFTSPDSSTSHWSCFRADCDELDLHAEMTTLYNRVQVNYSGVDGRPRVVTRTTSVPELDRIGATRTAVLDGGTSTQAGAQTLGDAFLALQGVYAPSRGTVTLSRPIRHYRRGLIQPWWMRADGSNLRVPDVLPSQQLFDLSTGPDRRSTFPIKRVTVDASGAYPVVQAELDQTSDVLSILQARLGLAASLIGVG
jgi:hypothetical protein